MKICPACSREYDAEHTVCLDDGVALVLLDTGAAARGQDLIGQVVDGRYKIERIVGRGGMGTVYSCRHVVVGKAFAMKVLRSGIERSEEVLHRFIREAQAANAVQSRHICEMTDFGQLPGGSFYVVMELLDGVSLTRALREKRLKYPDIKRVFIQIAETLEKAHRVNIVHRDLKPDNVVLVHDDGDPFFVKLVDFGIAKVMQSRASNLTETGVILGTPYYLSPEQALGDDVEHRSDIYALGVMMYRSFTGKLPFVADTAMGVLTRHLTEQPELPSTIADMNPVLERLIMRCLEKKPIARFQTMHDLAKALKSIPSERTTTPTAHPTADERSPLSAARVPAAGQSGAAKSRAVRNPPRTEHTPTKLATPLAKSGRAIPSAMPAPQEPNPAADASPVPHADANPPAAPTYGPQPGDPHQPGSPQFAGAHGAPQAQHGEHGSAHPTADASGRHVPVAHQSGQYAAYPTADGGQHAPVAHQRGQYAAYPTAGAHPHHIHPHAHIPPGMQPVPLVAGNEDPLQGEAGTARGVVSSRMMRVGARNSNRVGIWIAASIAMAGVGALGAYLLFGRPPPPPTDSSASTEQQPSDTAVSDDDPAPASSAVTTATTAPETSTAPTPESSASVSPSATSSAPPPNVFIRPPRNPRLPPPEIRSPFD